MPVNPVTLRNSNPVFIIFTILTPKRTIMNKNHYCVIMAGGIGSRFWPLSKITKPKQFLDILGTGRSLLQATYDRFSEIILPSNIIIVTNAGYRDFVFEQLPDLNPAQVLLEPMRKNTAPCIAYANHRIRIMNPDAVVVVSPADHLILKQDVFLNEIKQALEMASSENVLLTLGIKPNRPETGYGYIQANTKTLQGKPENLRKVKTFTEKPDIELARVFFESGEFYWNSGIFIWSLNAITTAFRQHLPEVDALFSSRPDVYNTDEEQEFITGVYATCKNISVDYGIMENAEDVYVFFSDFGWSDLGSWGSLYDHSTLDNDGNMVSGENVFSYDVRNCIINVPHDKIVVLQGLDNYIVVESGNILLVCRKEDEQRIKQFVNDVKIEKGEEYI
jgi:mannose-1-phosphate guanylyltransferase